MQRLLILDHLANNTLTLDDFDKRDHFTDNIISEMTEENLISKGAVGKIFTINDEIVVKQVKPCMSKKDSALQRYCIDMNKLYYTDIVGIAGGNGKYRYILPNLLSEITIGLILGDLDLAFANTITSMIVREENTKKQEDIAIYIAMEKLNPLVINNALTIKLNYVSLLCMLFQISQGLLAAQQEYKFTHYDLHIENLLYGHWGYGKKYISYPLPNQNMKMMIMKEYCPYIFKIADFALARIETDKTILSSTIDDYPLRTYAEFNPSYDFACLLGSILVETKHETLFHQLYDQLENYKFVIQLTLWYYKESINVSNLNRNELDSVKNYIANKYYKSFGKVKKYSFRPIQDEDFIPYINTQSMVDVVNYIASYLITTKYVKIHQNKPDVINVKDLGLYNQYDPVIIYNDMDKPMIISNYVSIYKTKLNIKLPPQNYNYTLEEKQIKNCPYQEQYMTVVKIDKGYEKYNSFFYDCCKIDAPNYMVQNNKYGFVVNGGFFSIKKDYLPIGPYKDKHNYINVYEIPPKYKHLYAYIVLKDNQLHVTKTLDLNHQVCSSGPILIDNSQIVIDIHNKIYHCSDKKHAGDFFLSQTDDTITLSGYNEYIVNENKCDVVKRKKKHTIKRCDKIPPGELSHASNPNPRTIFCVTTTGYLFIIFDGRSLYGDGVDLLEAAKIIMKKFPNTITAINLDGGRSSVVAWRSIYDKNIVYNNSNFRNYYYPAGYVIGLLKK
jgi:hypothetical protein